MEDFAQRGTWKWQDMCKLASALLVVLRWHPRKGERPSRCAERGRGRARFSSVTACSDDVEEDDFRRGIEVGHQDVLSRSIKSGSGLAVQRLCYERTAALDQLEASAKCSRLTSGICGRCISPG